jgi:hypothetical protein
MATIARLLYIHALWLQAFLTIVLNTFFLSLTKYPGKLLTKYIIFSSVNNNSNELIGYYRSTTTCEELIDGLRDRFEPVRYHSYRELEKRTGISFKPIIGRDPDAYPREYGEIVWFYNNWYRKNKENLRFNKAKGQFEINNRL